MFRISLRHSQPHGQPTSIEVSSTAYSLRTADHTNLEEVPYLFVIIPTLMASDLDRDLRRLAKRYRIAFHPNASSDQWPSRHRETFENIQTIGNQAYNTYSTNVDIRSREQPWKAQTQYRAKWLAERCARLLNQQRNEAGWRFGLENDVLRRFAVEVAW